jgi:hypothetical protein
MLIDVFDAVCFIWVLMMMNIIADEILLSIQLNTIFVNYLMDEWNEFG